MKRREYDEETVRWADAVIAAGGNGVPEIKKWDYRNAPCYSRSAHPVGQL